jgi:cell division protein FtsW
MRRLIAAPREFLSNQSPRFIWLLSLTSLTVLLGLIMVLSSSTVWSLIANDNAYAVFAKQAGSLAVGFALMLFLAGRSTEWIFRMAPGAYLAALILQMAVLWTPIGVSIGGNKNWLRVGPITIQPSEFIKLGLILLLAKLISDSIQHIHSFENFSLRLFVAGGAGVGLVFAGHDLGTAIVLGLILIGLIFLSGVPMRNLRVPLAVAAVGLFIGVSTGASRMARITAWLNPGTDDSSPFDWQSQHGIWALAAGGFSGVGLGASKLKWSWVPEADNDYIFAIIGEEWGWIGAVIVVVLFILIINFIRMIAADSGKLSSHMAAVGIMLWLSVQAFLNIGVVISFFPVLGVPLPLISSGGSSLVASMMAVGIILAIDRENNGSVSMPRARRKIRVVK